MHVFLSGLRQHWLRRTVLVIVAIALFGRGDFAGQAQEKEEQQAARPPLGRRARTRPARAAERCPDVAARAPGAGSAREAASRMARLGRP